MIRIYDLFLDFGKGMFEAGIPIWMGWECLPMGVSDDDNFSSSSGLACIPFCSYTGRVENLSFMRHHQNFVGGTETFGGMSDM